MKKIEPKALVADLKMMVEFAKSGIVSKTIVDSKDVRYILFCFEAGQKLSKHTAPFAAGIYVLQGEGKFLLGNKAYKGVEGSFFHMPPGLLHAITATKNLVFLLSMVKAKSLR